MRSVHSHFYFVSALHFFIKMAEPIDRIVMQRVPALRQDRNQVGTKHNEVLPGGTFLARIRSLRHEEQHRAKQ